jgi:hypothetical protein
MKRGTSQESLGRMPTTVPGLAGTHKPRALNSEYGVAGDG